MYLFIILQFKPFELSFRHTSKGALYFVSKKFNYCETVKCSNKCMIMIILLKFYIVFVP